MVDKNQTSMKTKIAKIIYNGIADDFMSACTGKETKAPDYDACGDVSHWEKIADKIITELDI